MTVAERFDTHHERADAMGKNILDKIDKRTKELNQKIDARANLLDEKIYTLNGEMMEGFDRVNRDIARVELRIDKVHRRFDQQEGRFDRLELCMADRFAAVDKEMAKLQAGFAELSDEFGDIKAMLISLGAKSPES
jgi:chromosome segregation ATPase